jgi:hypothetical protein
MHKFQSQGTLAENPLPELLMSLWQSKSSGYLHIKKHTEEKKIGFRRGIIVVERESFNEKDFLASLVGKGILDPSGLKRCLEFAKLNKTSFIAALIDLRGFSPAALWELLDNFIKEDLFFLFDWSFGDYVFDSEHTPHLSSILFSVQPPDFVLHGIRQMKNDKLIKTYLPPETKSVQKHAPEYWDQISLNPPEEYILNAVTHNKDLMSIYAASVLGKRETQKIIFAFLSLGILSPALSKTPKGIIHGFSSAELERILDSFNAKCSYISKYISKKLGPVAMNVIEKCIEDVRPNLSPFFQNIRLGAEGKFEVSSLLESNASFKDEEGKNSFLKSLNEILAAEVLAVKRALGDEHESALVKNLEKIGEKP